MHNLNNALNCCHYILWFDSQVNVESLVQDGRNYTIGNYGCVYMTVQCT